jgi:hypothetical protein
MLQFVVRTWMYVTSYHARFEMAEEAVLMEREERNRAWKRFEIYGLQGTRKRGSSGEPGPVRATICRSLGKLPDLDSNQD